MLLVDERSSDLLLGNALLVAGIQQGLSLKPLDNSPLSKLHQVQSLTKWVLTTLVL